MTGGLFPITTWLRQDSDDGQEAAPLHPLPVSEQVPFLLFFILRDSLFCCAKVAHFVAKQRARCSTFREI
jgi:hypothetical protein